MIGTFTEARLKFYPTDTAVKYMKSKWVSYTKSMYNLSPSDGVEIKKIKDSALAFIESCRTEDGGFEYTMHNMFKEMGLGKVLENQSGKYLQNSKFEIK